MIVQIQPWIDDEELEELTDLVRSTWVTEHKKAAEFTQKLRELSGAKHVLVVDHGTVALYLCLRAAGIGPGDEVIVPDLTFAATSNAVLWSGATPVFVDCSEQSWLQMDASRIGERITSKTRAIMPVHLYGHAADMDEVLRVARQYDLLVIEDAAQGVGTTFRGRQVGTIGEMGIFSFYGNKTITTGEGGAVLTNSDTLYERAEKLAHEGRTKGSFVHQEFGLNFHFTELQAAVGLAQLRKLPRIIERKRRLNALYRQQLADLPEVAFEPLDDRVFATFWMTNVFLPDAEGLGAWLLEQGVQTRRLFYPLHWQPCYRELEIAGSFPVAERSYTTGLSLPSSAQLPEEAVAVVCDRIRAYFSFTRQ